MENETKIMNGYEIQKYAQDNGFDSLEFIMIKPRPMNGKFIDAYFGMIQLPDLGEGFITIDQLIKEVGFDNLSFMPLS